MLWRIFPSSVLVALTVLGGAQSIGSGLLIENVTLIDGTGRPPREGANILIEGNRIQQISYQPFEPPSGTTRVDGSGKYLIPGLMDMHVHIRGVLGQGNEKAREKTQAAIRALHSYLYVGVTSIFDAGNQPSLIMDLRDREREGKITSPRVFATGGVVTYPGSHGADSGSTLVDDWPEAIPKLDKHIALKPDLVKLTYEERGWGSRPMIPRLPAELMEKVIEYFNNQGIRSTVHASSELRARQAIFAGIDTLAHPIIQGPISPEFAQLMGAKQIPMVSTLTIGEGYSRLVSNPAFLDQPFYKATLEPGELQRLKTEERDRQKARPWTVWMQTMTPIAQENLHLIHENGGVIVAGTDQSLGPALHRELELLVSAGLSPIQTIRTATLNAAIFLGKRRDMGSIEEGKLADLVLLNADPSLDINNAKQIHTVIKDGKIINRARLDLPVNRGRK